MKRWLVIGLFLLMGGSALWSTVLALDDSGPEPLQLRREAVETGSDTAAALDTEAHARVAKWLLIFAGLNALWSAAPGSWISDLVRGIRGPVADNLFLPLDLRRRGPAEQGPEPGYLRRLTRRRVWLYTKTPLVRGDRVTIRQTLRMPGRPVAQPMGVVVRLVKKIRDVSSGKLEVWYQVEGRFESSATRQGQGWRQLPIAGLTRDADPRMI